MNSNAAGDDQYDAGLIWFAGALLCNLLAIGVTIVLALVTLLSSAT